MRDTTTLGEGEAWDPLAVRRSIRPYIWAALALITCLGQGPGFIASLRPAPKEGVDFFQEWSSAKNLLSGLPVYMDLERAAERYVGYKRGPGDEVLFTKNAHPPPSILLALPFAFLSYPNATLAWNLISLAALAVSLWLIARGLELRPKPWMFFPAIVMLLTFNPLRQQVNQGQLNLVLLLLLTAAWSADRSRHPRAAGLALGVATAVKVFPGFVFLYFLLRRQWRTVVHGVLGFLAATGVTLLILGPEAYAAYIWEVMPQVSEYQNGWINVSLAGFWTKWFAVGAASPMAFPDLPRHIPPLMAAPALARIGLLVSAAIVLMLWARSVLRSPARGRGDLAFGLTLTAMLVLSPITWDHYFLLLALPLTQLWLAESPFKRRRPQLLMVVGCIWAHPLTFWTLLIPQTEPRGFALLPSLVAVSIQCFALIGLFAMLLTTRRNSASRTGSLSENDPGVVAV